MINLKYKIDPSLIRGDPDLYNNGLIKNWACAIRTAKENVKKNNDVLNDLGFLMKLMCRDQILEIIDYSELGEKDLIDAYRLIFSSINILQHSNQIIEVFKKNIYGDLSGVFLIGSGAKKIAEEIDYEIVGERIASKDESLLNIFNNSEEETSQDGILNFIEISLGTTFDNKAKGSKNNIIVVDKDFKDFVFQYFEKPL